MHTHSPVAWFTGTQRTANTSKHVDTSDKRLFWPELASRVPYPEGCILDINQSMSMPTLHISPKNRASASSFRHVLPELGTTAPHDYSTPLSSLQSHIWPPCKVKCAYEQRRPTRQRWPYGLTAICYGTQGPSRVLTAKQNNFRYTFSQ